jgi:hypothetical protein
MTTVLKTPDGFTVLEGALSEDFVFERGLCDFDENHRTGALEFTSRGLRKLERLGLWKLETQGGRIVTPPPTAGEFIARAKIAKPAPPAPPPLSPAAAAKIMADAQAAYAAKHPPKPAPSAAWSPDEVAANINAEAKRQRGF